MANGKTDTWYPRYPADYLKDTLQLTMEEDCFFSRALDQLWILKGALPVDEARLQKLLRTSRSEFQRCKWILETYFYQEGESYRNRRADIELAKAQHNVQVARENGGRGGRPRKPVGIPKGIPEENPLGTPRPNPNTKPTETSSPSPSVSNETESPLPPKGGSPPTSPILDAAEVRKAWEDFLAMRRRIRKPATARAQELLLAKLERMAKGDSPSAIAVLDQSTLKAWQDLYHVKSEQEHGIHSQHFARRQSQAERNAEAAARAYAPFLHGEG